MDKRHTEEEKNIVNKFNEYKEFIKDKHVSFVIKKAERITYGVYMLSQFLPEEDSLRIDLKKASHAILESVSRFVTVAAISEHHINRVHGYLQYLSTLLSLSYISGYVSASNIEIMKNEINYLHKHIEELSTSSISEKKQFHIKSDMFVVQQHAPRIHQKTEKATEQKMSLKKKNIPSEKPAPKKVEAPRDDRESRVIDVIRDKGVVSIKDISTVVFDVSEKTIQRTLQALIDKGQIKKEGERRWAKYELV